MANKAAYFSLAVKADGTYLMLYQGEDGKRHDLKEIEDYLHWKNIEYDRTAVLKAVSDVTAFSCVKISSAQIAPENESVYVKINEARSEAVGRFYPASSNGKKMTRDDIISSLLLAGVKFGLIEEALDSFLEDPQYNQDYLLAKAMPQVEGKNAAITYHFNTDLSRKPKLNEDGSVDFHQLETLNPVHAGDCIATLTPAIPGKPGIDVTGRVIRPANVKRIVLKQEKNTQVSEDGCQLLSLVDGHVSLISGSIFVSNNYEIPADVDTSTGDISFEGTVMVRGNVLTGFTVRAKGDIIVDGVVEGAELYAGGQIILKRGIQGMGRGKLNAEGNVISKFIENAEVYSGGYVETDAILHSRVTARGEVIASGRRGLVAGGEIRSGAGISVKTAGSSMGTATLLEIGCAPELMAEYHRLNEELPKMEAELEKVTRTYALLSKRMRSGEKLEPDKLELLRAACQSKLRLGQDIKQSVDRMNELQEQAGEQSGGCVRVKGVIYPGVKVILYNVIYHVRSQIQYCRLIKDRAEVKMVEY